MNKIRTKLQLLGSSKSQVLRHAFRSHLSLFGVKHRIGKKAVDESYSNFHYWKRKCGTQWAINRFKQTVNYLLYGTKGIRLTKKGGIKYFPYLSRLPLRVQLSLLYIYREERDLSLLSFDSITTLSNYDHEKFIDKFSLDFMPFLKRFRNRQVEILRSYPLSGKSERVLFASLKRGPNGPSSLASEKDIYAIQQDPQLQGRLHEMLSYLGIESTDLYRSVPTPSKPVYHSKISVVADKGGKARVIAIPDYLTQISLYSLHNFFMDCLKEIPSDSTFDHRGGFNSLVKSGSKYFSSIDLKNATDRFPIKLQCWVLNELFPGLGDIWSALLVERGYYCNVDKTYKRYAVGQPMGALSSWPIFSFTHHMILSTCGPYRMLGDDVVLLTKEGELRYKSILNLLDVPFKECPFENRGFEFAKFIYVRDKGEVTPITWGNAKPKSSDIWYLNSIRQLYNRTGLLLDYKHIPRSWSKWPIHLEYVKDTQKWKREFISLPKEYKVYNLLLCVYEMFLDPKSFARKVRSSFSYLGRFKRRFMIARAIDQMEEILSNVEKFCTQIMGFLTNKPREAIDGHIFYLKGGHAIKPIGEGHLWEKRIAPFLDILSNGVLLFSEVSSVEYSSQLKKFLYRKHPEWDLKRWRSTNFNDWASVRPFVVSVFGTHVKA